MKINNKFKKSKTRLENILIIMIAIYIFGVVLGCFLMFIDKDSSSFLITIIKNSFSMNLASELSVFFWIKSLFNDAIFFSLIFLLKYSGVLKVLTSSIPLFLGVRNALQYSAANINNINLIEILASFVLKDTAISFLLILCTSAVISEIIKQKDDIKYDFRIFVAYIVAITSVYLIDISLKMIMLI